MSEARLAPATYRTLAELTLSDLESIRLLLRGGSVIDWARLAFRTETDVAEFLGAHEFDLSDPASRARSEAIKNAAIQYLRRNFDFPIPKPVSDASVAELLLVASGRGHRQLCACTILKVMHIIHHLEARELLYMLPISDQDVFHLVEQKVYRVIGSMLARGLPILEFIGGRKNKDSLYSKLLSKKETHAAQIYDKLRFRIVTRSQNDVFPVLAYLERVLFPFNYIVPGESTNTMFDFLGYVRKHPSLGEVGREIMPLPEDDALEGANDNVFSSQSYRIVHFVVDLPVRLPDDILELAPPAALGLGRVVFAQAEFQVVDRETEQSNELGDASHDAYKDRQKQAVVRRLKLGAAGAVEKTAPAIVLPDAPPTRASTLPPPAKPPPVLSKPAPGKPVLSKPAPKPPAPRTQPRRKNKKKR